MSEKSRSRAPVASSGRERRDYFRVSEDVIFDFHTVDAFTANNEQAENSFDDAISMSLMEELRRLDKDNAQTLRLLTEKNRLLGDYLQTLSSKIDLIARHTLFSHRAKDEKQAKTRINISEDGAAFLSDRSVYKGNFLALRMIFLPHYNPVVSFAKVIRCEAKGDNYFVAVKFHRLPDSMRQEISRQLIKIQVQQKRRGEKKPLNDG